MRSFLVVTVILALALMGCGASKDYVQQQIEQSESRVGAQVSDLRDQTDGNAQEIAKLRSLAQQLSEKTDMALDKAEGFENYQIIWQGEINFDFDSHMITGAAEHILIEAGEKMEEHAGAVIEIAGHTDRTGSGKYNLTLGQLRAAAAKRFLADRFGISLYRMFIISYGEQKPIAMPDERHAASKNRRVTLTIWGEL